MRQSGCEVPEWMLKLPSPSKMLRRQLRRKPVERKDVRAAAGSTSIGRREARRRRDMVLASKRKKLKTAERDAPPTQQRPAEAES